MNSSRSCQTECQKIIRISAINRMKIACSSSRTDVLKLFPMNSTIGIYSMSIYVQLAGGLGNQLFQYGAALLLQRAVKKSVFLIPVKSNTHSDREYRHIYRRATSVDAVPSQIKSHVLYAYAEWDPEVFDDCSYDLLLMGCYQHLPTFIPVLPSILHDLGAFLVPYRDVLRTKYALTDLSSIGFLHVRRGDYLTVANGTIHYVQGPEYYKEAFKAFGPLRWFVLSNDVEWCRGEPTFSDCTVVDEPDELYGLALMSLCHGGAIIGNSTYSWWGAMLGAEAAGATVVYPSRWTAHQDPNLCPSHWIRL